MDEDIFADQVILSLSTKFPFLEQGSREKERECVCSNDFLKTPEQHGHSASSTPSHESSINTHSSQ